MATTKSASETPVSTALPYLGQSVVYHWHGSDRAAFVVADEGDGKYTLNVVSTPADGLPQPGLIQVNGVSASDFS